MKLAPRRRLFLFIAWPAFVFVASIAALGLVLFEPPPTTWHGVAFRFFTPIGLAGGMAFGMTQAVDGFHRRRRDAVFALLPRKINIHRDEMKQTAIVERVNGELLTVELPVDYDPRDDNGRMLVEAMLPPDVARRLLDGADA